jgi:hypothetical protein
MVLLSVWLLSREECVCRAIGAHLLLCGLAGWLLRDVRKTIAQLEAHQHSLFHPNDQQNMRTEPN